MDLKIFSNTIVLSKVDRFKGFSNWSNVDEFVINSTSVCNFKKNNKNYKLNNSLDSVFLFLKLSNLDHKFPLHVAICLLNLVYF